MAFAKKINLSGQSASTKGDLVFYCLMLLIPLVQIGIFYFGVNFQSIMMSFQVYSTVDNAFTWDASRNFNLFLNDIKEPWFWAMVKDSFVVWVASQFAGTVLALLFSYYIYKKRTLSKFFKFVLFLPSIIPGILLSLIFKFFMNTATPVFMNKLFYGGERVVEALLQNPNLYFWIITIYSTWIGFGSQVLVYSGAMDQIPTEMIEAGKLDGVTPVREFFSLILPTVMPTVTTFIVAGVATIFTNQNNLFAIFGGNLPGTDQTIGYYLYTMVSGQDSMGNYCYASFLGLVSTCIAVPITFVVRKILQRVGDR